MRRRPRDDEPVQLLRRAVVAQVVAAVVGDQQRRAVGRERQAVRVAQAARLDPQPAPAGLEADDRPAVARAGGGVAGAADAEVEPPAGAGHDVVDAVRPGRDALDDRAAALEAPPVEARVRGDAAGVGRRFGAVRDDVADVELAAEPRQSERGVQAADHVARLRAAALDVPDAVAAADAVLRPTSSRSRRRDRTRSPSGGRGRERRSARRSPSGRGSRPSARRGEDERGERSGALEARAAG